MTRGFQSSGDDLTGRELAPPLRGGGFQLPGLKHWRLRRGLSQIELARRADLSTDYLWNVESGRRGCNPSVAQHLADLLKVDLPDLRTKYDDAQEEAQAASGVEGARRSPCKAESCNYGRRVRPKLSSPLLYANSVQIGLVEPYNPPALTEGEAEVVLKHGLEDGPGYPFSVDEDAVRHASIHRLEKVPGALRDYDHVVVALQVPALQVAIGGSV